MSKWLAVLAQLPKKQELGCLKIIAINLMDKCTWVMSKYTEEGLEEFVKATQRWLNGMIKCIEVLMQKLREDENRESAIEEAITEYLKLAGKTPGRKVNSGNVNRCKETYMGMLRKLNVL